MSAKIGTRGGVRSRDFRFAFGAPCTPRAGVTGRAGDGSGGAAASASSGAGSAAYLWDVGGRLVLCCWGLARLVVGLVSEVVGGRGVQCIPNSSKYMPRTRRIVFEFFVEMRVELFSSGFSKFAFQKKLK